MFSDTTFEWQSVTLVSLKLWFIFVLVSLMAWFPCILWMIFEEHHLDIRKSCCLSLTRKLPWIFVCFWHFLTISDSNLSPNKNSVSWTNISFFLYGVVFLRSPVICFRALKCFVCEISLKAWPSNKFVRILGSETSKWELLAFSTVV